MDTNRAASIIVTENDKSVAQSLITKAGFGHWERLTYGELTHALAYVTLCRVNPIGFADDVRNGRDERGIIAQMNRF